MISNMFRFPFSMLDNEINSLFYPEQNQGSTRSTYVYPPINISTTNTKVFYKLVH